MWKRKCPIYIGAVLAIVTVVASTLGTASQAGTPFCPPGTERFVEHRLFFGRSQGGGEVVDDAAWQTFLTVEITPRFPDGLTVLNAAGQWRNASGTIERERTKVVLILTKPDDAGMQRTAEIAEAYKHTFGQDSVLRTITEICAAF